MNRSIFQIWRKFNLGLFLINFVFILFMYFFGFICGDFVSCDDLIKIIHKGVVIRYSPTLSPFRLYGSFEFLQQYVINTPGSHFMFNIYKYLQLSGQHFPVNHVYNHYHLNLYLNNMYNVHYNFSLTHHPEKLGLLPQEFSRFSLKNLFGKTQSQYILHDLKIYDLEVLKIQNDTDKFKQFILKNNKKCILQFKDIFNKK